MDLKGAGASGDTASRAISQDGKVWPASRSHKQIVKINQRNHRTTRQWRQMTTIYQLDLPRRPGKGLI